MAIQAVAAPVVGAAKVMAQATMQVMRTAGQGAASAVRGMGSAATRTISTGARSAASAGRGVARMPRPNGVAMQARSLPRVEPSRISASNVRQLTKGPAKGASKSRDDGLLQDVMKLFLDSQKGDDGRGR